MKKLFIVYLCSIIVTFPVLSINFGQIAIVPVPDNFPVELTNRILLDLAQNAHNYVEKTDNGPVHQVKDIIRTVSILNKEWYAKLDKQRNDPVTTRIMIHNIGIICYVNSGRSLTSFPPVNIVGQLRTPGAKKCIELSNQLYDNNLSIEKIEQLYKDGAILDYYNGLRANTVLSHWVLSNQNNSIDIMEKLLQLGTNPDVYFAQGNSSPLKNAMCNGTLEKNKLLLSYKAKKEWCIAFNNSFYRFIDLFIEYSTKDELNEGLTVCANNFYSLEIMQKLIDKGANPSVPLVDVSKKVIESMADSAPDNKLAQLMQLNKFNFLCDQKAYDETVLVKIQNLQVMLSSLANKLEQNKPVLHDKI
jgi:hypothetical protein